MNIAPERFIILIFFTCTFSFAQVGINTTSPNGILDINSTSQGVVLPRLALTATTVMAPAGRRRDCRRSHVLQLGIVRQRHGSGVPQGERSDVRKRIIPWICGSNVSESLRSL